MLAHTTSTVALVVIAAGILFQLVISARVGARFARNRLRRPAPRPRASHGSPEITPNRVRHPHRDYRAALRAAGHRADRTV
jgi:hypothetical protein